MLQANRYTPVRTLYLSFIITLFAAASVPCQSASYKVAWVNSTAFLKEGCGIERLTQAVATVDQEFAPLTVDQRKERECVLEIIVGTRAGITDREQVIFSDYGNRLRQAVTPVYAEMLQHLKSFVQQRGANILLDARSPSPCIMFEQDLGDLTDAFASEYNKLYPAPVR